MESNTLVSCLSVDEILVSTGSACNSKAGYNRVLQQIVGKDYIEGAIRISFGADITIQDCIDLAIMISKRVKEYKERIMF